MKLLCVLFCLVSGVLSDLHLEESGPGVVGPSQTLSLLCSVTGGSVTGTTFWHWVRQTPEKGLVWLGFWAGRTGNTNYSPGFQDRVSITADTSKNQFSLQLKSVTIEDSAMYFCVITTGGDDYWGKGAFVTVSSDPKVAPTLFPMSSFSPETGSSVVLGCLAQGFFPVPVNMTWTFSGSKGSVRSYPAMLSGSTYSQSSVLDLPADQCTESQSYECHVDHYGISATVNVPCKASISCCCPCTLEPSVSLSAPSLESLLLGKGVNLTCTLSGLKSKDGIKFTWTRTPTQELTLNAIQGTPEQDSSGRYSVSSILEIFAEEWTHGNTFSCTVSHPEIETTTKTIFKPNVPQIPPQVYLLPPSADELALNELVSIICLVRSFSPNEVMIQWLKGNENLPKKDYIINGPYPESRGSNTFLLTSIIQVLASDWNAESKYSCVVGHEALPLNFTQKTIDRYSGKPTNVNVSVIMSDVHGTCY